MPKKHAVPIITNATDINITMSSVSVKVFPFLAVRAFDVECRVAKESNTPNYLAAVRAVLAVPPLLTVSARAAGVALICVQ
jgi:hypothetical protein